MVQPAKRIPGERNPEPGTEAPMHVARESWTGGHDYGIARAIGALLDWHRRRKGGRVQQSSSPDG